MEYTSFLNNDYEYSHFLNNSKSINMLNNLPNIINVSKPVICDDYNIYHDIISKFDNILEKAKNSIIQQSQIKLLYIENLLNLYQDFLQTLRIETEKEKDNIELYIDTIINEDKNSMLTQFQLQSNIIISFFYSKP